MDRERREEEPERGFGDPRLREDREFVGDPELRASRADGDERKEQARQEYVLAGFPQESFEADWPAIRSRLASEEIARRLVVDDAEPRDLQGTRREGWWGGWLGLVIVAIIILWLWWIAIWGWGAWGNTGAQGNGGFGGGRQNQPVQQAPQNGAAGQNNQQAPQNSQNQSAR